MNDLATARYTLTGTRPTGTCQLSQDAGARTVPDEQRSALQDIQDGMSALARSGAINQSTSDGTQALGQAQTKITSARTHYQGANDLIGTATAMRDAHPMPTNPPVPSDPAYQRINDSYVNGKAGITTEVSRLNGVQHNIETVLQQAEAAVKPGVGPSGDGGSGSAPTMVQILAMNTNVTTNMTAAITAYKPQQGGGTPNPSAAGGGAGADPNTNVTAKLTAATRVITPVCNALVGQADCSGSGQGQGQAPTGTQISGVVDPVTQARTAQLTALNSIATSAGALSNNGGNPSGSVASTAAGGGAQGVVVGGTGK
jgi:hypothetical protein